MLKSLSIRNFVLIESIELSLDHGLTVVTGETGAGKSVVLDAIGLILGARADKSLIRSGAKAANLSAVFEPEELHPVHQLLDDMGLRTDGEAIIIRRVVNGSGGGRAFVNDEPVSLSGLRQIGAAMVEIHGQHDERGLLNPSGHRDLLDTFGSLVVAAQELRQRFENWQRAEDALTDQLAAKARAEAEADFIQLASGELSALAPEEAEEESLVEERALLANAGRIAGDIEEASEIVTGGDGLETRLAAALRRLERSPPEAAELIKPAAEAIDRVLIELREARQTLDEQMRSVRHDPARLEQVEERLYALRAAARKYRVSVAALPAKWREIEASRSKLQSADTDIARLSEDVAKARGAFEEGAQELSAARRQAALRFDKEVNAELAALKLANAEFMTSIEPLELDRASPTGLDRIEFRVRTNKGGRPGPLSQIASGGELSRFLLALKVVLAATGSSNTLIFDEIDRGIGGAVADAVGERLSKLALDAQVLVVTHSPQVAARGDHHYLAAKESMQDATTTSFQDLSVNARTEEIARMLAGARVTTEARAAAEQLLAARTGAAKKKTKGKSQKRRAAS